MHHLSRYDPKRASYFNLNILLWLLENVISIKSFKELKGKTINISKSETINDERLN